MAEHFTLTNAVLLFTALCLCCFTIVGDAVYLDDEPSLEEYIMSQDGIIFRGDHNYTVPSPWNFGQVPTQLTPRHTCQLLAWVSELEVCIFWLKSITTYQMGNDDVFTLLTLSQVPAFDK